MQFHSRRERVPWPCGCHGDDSFQGRDGAAQDLLLLLLRNKPIGHFVMGIPHDQSVLRKRKYPSRSTVRQKFASSTRTCALTFVTSHAARLLHDSSRVRRESGFGDTHTNNPIAAAVRGRLHKLGQKHSIAEAGSRRSEKALLQG